MVEKYTLRNGIPVFVVENHASPVVSIQAWVSRGSVYETEKEAGISHFLEHAVFKGTKRRKVGQIALEIEARGGEVNAFTSFEETAFYTTLASRYFEDGLDVIADALQNPSFDAAEMAREKEVILEEIKRAHDSPMKMASMNLWKVGFHGSEYSRPVLGFDSTVKKIDHKVLARYFAKNYHAGSLSLFVVGDIDPKFVFKKANEQFGKMKKGPSSRIPKVTLAKSSKPKLISLSRDLKECHLHIAWRTPDIKSPMIPVLDILCSAFGQGESSRLYQHLVKDKQIALESHMGLMATARGGLATLSLETAPENLHSATDAAIQLLEEAARSGLRAEEIDRVKSSLEAEVVNGKETVEGYARRLGYYYIQFGDPEYEKRYLEEILAVEADEVNKALNTLLDSRPVASLVHPLDYDHRPDVLLKSLTRTKHKHTAPAAPKAAIERKTRGGMRFIEKVSTSLPIVSFRMIFPGGAKDENPSQLGLTTLFQRLWTSGTKSYHSRQIAHTLESLGASLHAFAGRHTCGLSVEFLAKHWPVIKPMLSEILAEPTFPEDEFATEKNLLLRDILSERDSPGAICHLNFLSSLFRDHTYGRSGLGKKETVSTISRDDVAGFYKNFIHQGKLVVSTVGHFNPETWSDELASVLKNLPSQGKTNLTLKPVTNIERTKLTIEKKQPLYQSHIMVGFLGADFHDPVRHGLKIISSALAGQGGRLFLELRDKQSLAYSVSPMNAEQPERGYFAFYIGCGPEKATTSLRGIRLEIEKLLQDPLSTAELDRAKRYWTGRFELEMQRFGSQAMLFGLDEMYGLGFDNYKRLTEAIQDVSAEEVHEAAKKTFQLDKAVISVVHNADLSEEEVLKAWSGKTTTARTESVKVAAASSNA